MKTKTMKLSGYAFAITLGLGLAATSCSSDDSSSTPLPDIGGYANANEVGAADLIAYWPLNGSGVESKSSTAPDATVGASYEAGAKGQGLKLTDGYLTYPSIAALNSVPNMSVSMWVKVSSNKGTANAHATSLFQLSRLEGANTHWAGNFTLMAETGNWGGDTLQVKALSVTKNADASANWQDVANQPKPSDADLLDGHEKNPNKVGGTWAHIVATWDGTTKTFKVYSNGQRISNVKWENRGGSPGAFDFYNPTKPIIGAFGTNIPGGLTPDGWQKPMTGNIDEIRIWTKALNAADINSLYELEKVGR